MNYIAPKDHTTKKIICIAEVDVEIADGQITINIPNGLAFINLSLDWVKQGHSIMGERGLVVDMQNDFYHSTDLYNEQQIIDRIFTIKL